MAARRGISGINLLPKDSFEFSVLGRALKWTTTVGRVMVVLTEFVVILAFASRFYFDKKVNDLTDTIDSKLTVIKGFAKTETDARIILARQAAIQAFDKDNIQFGQKINLVSQVLPNGASLESLKFDGKKLDIKGSVGSELAFSQMLKGLRKDKSIKTLELGQSIYDQNQGKMTFNITLTYK